MYARDAAVKFNPIPPHVMVARSTAIPELSRNARRTLSRPAVDRLPSRRTHRIDRWTSAGWSKSNVLVQVEKTTLAAYSLVRLIVQKGCLLTYWCLLLARPNL